MYLLNEFATRYKKEIYKTRNLTPKQGTKQLGNLAKEVNKSITRDLNNSVNEVVMNSKGFRNSLPNISKPVVNDVTKTKLLTGKKLAIAGGVIAGTGLLAAGVNKLHKSRKDKGRLRGKYK